MRPEASVHARVRQTQQPFLVARNFTLSESAFFVREERQSARRGPAAVSVETMTGVGDQERRRRGRSNAPRNRDAFRRGRPPSLTPLARFLSKRMVSYRTTRRHRRGPPRSRADEELLEEIATQVLRLCGRRGLLAPGTADEPRLTIQGVTEIAERRERHAVDGQNPSNFLLDLSPVEAIVRVELEPATAVHRPEDTSRRRREHHSTCVAKSVALVMPVVAQPPPPGDRAHHVLEDEG